MIKRKILSICCLTVGFVLSFGTFALAEKPLPVEVQNTVTVTGDVSVVNAPENAVPVNVIKPPAKEIFRYTENLNSENSGASFQVTGPKRLVIEFVSLNFAVVPLNEAPDNTEDFGLHVIFNISNSQSSFQYVLPSASAARGIFGAHLRLGAQPVKIYAEPGDTVSILCNYDGPSVFGGKVGLSGYYEEVPAR